MAMEPERNAAAGADPGRGPVKAVGGGDLDDGRGVRRARSLGLRDRCRRVARSRGALVVCERRGRRDRGGGEAGGGERSRHIVFGRDVHSWLPATAWGVVVWGGRVGVGGQRAVIGGPLRGHSSGPAVGRVRGQRCPEERMDYRILGPLEWPMATGRSLWAAIASGRCSGIWCCIAMRSSRASVWSTSCGASVRLRRPGRSCRTTSLGCAARWVRAAATGRWRPMGGVIGCGSSRGRSISSVSSVAWSPDSRR